MPRFAIVLFVLIGAVFAASAGLLLARARSHGRGETPGSRDPADPLTPDDNTGGLSIPPFTLTDQDGRTITNDIFTGRVTIVDFFFTHCKLACPVLIQHMLDQARALKGTGVRLLSISVDPDHDTPQVIAGYAREKGADLSRWTFATGDRQSIGKIVQGGLKFLVGEDTRPENAVKLEDGSTMNNIMHPQWFVLAGPRGEVLGIYRSDSPEDMAALTDRARGADTKLRR